MNLRDARKSGKIQEFITEREAEPHGDRAAFNRALSSMAQMSKEAPAASKRERGDD